VGRRGRSRAAPGGWAQALAEARRAVPGPSSQSIYWRIAPNSRVAVVRGEIPRRRQCFSASRTPWTSQARPCSFRHGPQSKRRAPTDQAEASICANCAGVRENHLKPRVRFWSKYFRGPAIRVLAACARSFIAVASRKPGPRAATQRKCIWGKKLKAGAVPESVGLRMRIEYWPCRARRVGKEAFE